MNSHAACGGVVIRTIDVFAVERDGRPCSAGAVAGKAATLLKLLTAERGRTVPTDRIVDVLWQDDPPKRPVENVATLVSRLRRALGPGTITGGRPGYQLGQAPVVTVDIDEAATLVTEAERLMTAGDPAVGGAAAARALEILGEGRILDGLDAHWTGQVQAEVTELLRRARHAAATAALAAAEPGRARQFAEAAATADPFDEAAHRLLMRAHAAEGEPAKALRTYERLRNVLTAELGADPAPPTRALHVAILREQLPVPRQPAAEERGYAGSAPAGRDAEVSRVAEKWAAAEAGHTGVLVIAGEAGIGKSCVVAEAVRIAASTAGTVLSARCHRTERSLFLQPFVDALRPQVTSLAEAVPQQMTGERAAALAMLVPEVAQVLGSPPGEPVISGNECGRVYDAVAIFLRGLAARAPVLLVLEDLHHAGPATLELVDYLARRMAGARLLILATLRPEEGTKALDLLGDAATFLNLGPLPPRAVAQLAAQALGPDAKGVCDRVFRRTNGHPFFVVEMLRGLAAGEGGLPEPVRAAVLGRVRRTGRQAEQALRAAAVLGSAFTPLTLARMLNMPTRHVAYLCERALNARLLIATGAGYEFANSVIREVLYATTPAPTRYVLHHVRLRVVSGCPEPSNGSVHTAIVV